MSELQQDLVEVGGGSLERNMYVIQMLLLVPVLKFD